jgi:hypothetical protein
MPAKKNKKILPIMLWIKRIGFWGFLFFLLKGLIWLAVSYWIIK